MTYLLNFLLFSFSPLSCKLSLSFCLSRLNLIRQSPFITSCGLHLDKSFLKLKFASVICSNFCICIRNHVVWPFKWNFCSSTFTCSLGPGSQWGERQKTVSNRKNNINLSEPSGILGRGKGPPFPLPRLPLDSLRSPILFFSPKPIFSPFSHNAEPGPSYSGR